MQCHILLLVFIAFITISSPLAGARPTMTTSSSPVKYNQSRLISSLKNGLASGMSAGCVKLCLAPFDTIKTLQQHSRTVDGSAALTLAGAARALIKRGGIGELYSGVAVTVLGSMPSVGLYFGVYHFCKKRGAELIKEMECPHPLMQTANIAMAAAIGNTVASFSRVPYEVVKQKLQTGLYSSTYTAITSMYADAGMLAFFPKGGVTIQMIRDIPYAVFTLLAYEFLQTNWAQKNNPTSETPVWKNMVAGAAAGGFGSLLTNPMDVVKTRIQTDPTMYNGIIDCAFSTLSEGPSAFMRGSVPRLMHKIPANGLFFVCYEMFRAILGVEGPAPR
ncbi:hypothetical protein TrLO_g4335 [Triparma laevis f. longispina]|uniref:Mitochondrial carrier protein n=1 Tax=Triparma laevis f. longispina TaxID=1714387 RepID=A0A9W7KXF5_9STRA|nr:hypothetical protein TrLO_g4335 [Triparma laevis f. longispina]